MEQVRGPDASSKDSAARSFSKRSAQMFALFESVPWSRTPNSSGP
jgi:hypothetical protein